MLYQKQHLQHEQQGRSFYKAIGPVCPREVFKTTHLQPRRRPIRSTTINPRRRGPIVISVDGKNKSAGWGSHHSRAKNAILADIAADAPDVLGPWGGMTGAPILGHRRTLPSFWLCHRVTNACEANEPTVPAADRQYTRRYSLRAKHVPAK